MALLNDTDGNPLATTIVVRLAPAVNVGGTLTVPAVVGKFFYCTQILIRRVAGSAQAGSTTLAITTTNLPGSLGWKVGNAMAAGDTKSDVALAFGDFPLKSVGAFVDVTLVLPAPGANTFWDVLVAGYYAA